MWMDLVAIVDPPGDLPQHRVGIRQGSETKIVTLEGSDEGLRHAIGPPRPAHRCESRDQVQGCGEVARFLGGVGTAVGVRSGAAPGSPRSASPRLSASCRAPADPGATYGGPGNDLAIEGINDEGHADDVAIPTGELQAVGSPTQVGAHHHDLAVRPMRRPI
jgi:hypothetical protein